MASARLAPARLWHESTAAPARRTTAPAKERKLLPPLTLVRPQLLRRLGLGAQTSCASSFVTAAPSRQWLGPACLRAAGARAQSQAGSNEPAFSKEQQSPLRVVVIGSSVAEGCNAENMQGWAYHLHKRLAEANIDLEV